jgi:hypothetical protein
MAQSALIQPALKTAMREVAKLRPAEPLLYLADRLLAGGAASPARDGGAADATEPAGGSGRQQSVAGYLSAEVLPAVHTALVELIRHRPPVTEDAALAAEIVARALRSGSNTNSNTNTNTNSRGGDEADCGGDDEAGSASAGGSTV